mmetsp:Transcript_108144/g.316189  ORF Transcript_108144/g.316189 Transcript_108144/m.316189 type:complete len:803 (+) Transcript_108144:121-2529(+)
MPPTTVCGQLFLFGTDDVALVAPVSACCHCAWLLAETNYVFRLAFWRLGIAPFLIDIDAGLLACGIALDLLIAALASRGPIMEPHRRRSAVFVLIPRWMVSFMLIVLLATQSVLLILNIFLLGRQRYSAVEHVGGWMQRDSDFVIIPALCVLVCLLTKLLAYSSFLGMLWFAHSDAEDPDSAAKRGIERVLRFFGADDKLIVEIAKVFLAVHGPETLLYAAPTDLFFGLVLHAARQEQIYLGRSQPEPRAREDTKHDEEAATNQGSRLPVGAVRASVIALASAFSPDSSEDWTVLKDLNHYWPYARGIYGCCVNACVTSLSEGTWIPSPFRLLRTLWAAMPCRQRTPREVSRPSWRCCGFLPPKGNVKGDDIFGFSSMEYALRRTLDAAAVQEGHHTPPKLIHATWDDLGLERSPPFALFVDDLREEIVITIRGTLSLWDCLSDATAAPVLFDPTSGVGLSRKDAVYWSDELSDTATGRLFDNDTGCYVHSGIWKCAIDAQERLEGFLLELKASGLIGYRVVCVGHSLGCGVACVLALLLRQEGGFADVRYVGFAPPGGTMSKKLTELTTSLGWLSGVCSHDMISRLSVHVLQELREKVLQELHECKRTKFQIAMLLLAAWWQQCLLLMFFSMPFSIIFEWLGGGGIEFAGQPLKTHSEAVEGAQNFLKTRAEARLGRSLDSTELLQHRALLAEAASEDEAETDMLRAGMMLRTLDVKFYPQLLPPGRVAYVRPTLAEPLLCGIAHRDTKWTAEWARPQDFSEVILAWRSVELHLPNIMEPAFRSALEELNRRRCKGYGTFT